MKNHISFLLILLAAFICNGAEAAGNQMLMAKKGTSAKTGKLVDDLALVGLVPGDTGCFRSEQIVATVRNVGDEPASNFMVTFRVNGTIPISTTVSSPLQPGASTEVHFANEFDFTSSGTYLLESWVNYGDDNNSGNDTLVNQVVSLEKPSADFSYSAGCVGDTFQFTDASSHSEGIANWQWFAGFSSNVVDGGQEMDIYFSSQTENIGLIVEANNGCSDTVAEEVEAHPDPQVAFSVTDDCQGLSLSFDNQSQISSGSIVTYEWDFDDGATSTEENPEHTFLQSAFYNVELKATSDQGCTDNVTSQVEIYPRPDADFEYDQPVCTGDTVTFTDQSNGNGDSVTSWSWDLDGGMTTTGQEASRAFDAEGDYHIQLVATTNNGCSDTIPDTVAALPTPKADFEQDQMAICEGDTLILIDQSSISAGSIANIQWGFGDGTTATDSVTEHAYQSEGSYELVLTATSQAGCTDDTTASISIFEKPPKPDVQQSGDTLYTTLEGSYQWYREGVQIPGAIDSFYVIDQPGEYTVEISYIECSNFSDPVIITGFNRANEAISGKLFPNPASEQINLEMQASEPVSGDLYIYSREGRLVRHELHLRHADGINRSVSIADLSTGLYYLVLRDKAGTTMAVWSFQKL